jgi:hypothetical protein
MTQADNSRLVRRRWRDQHTRRVLVAPALLWHVKNRTSPQIPLGAKQRHVRPNDGSTHDEKRDALENKKSGSTAGVARRVHPRRGRRCVRL